MRNFKLRVSTLIGGELINILLKVSFWSALNSVKTANSEKDVINYCLGVIVGIF